MFSPGGAKEREECIIVGQLTRSKSMISLTLFKKLYFLGFLFFRIIPYGYKEV